MLNPQTLLSIILGFHLWLMTKLVSSTVQICGSAEHPIMSAKEETNEIYGLITKHIAPHYVLDKRQFHSLFNYMSDNETWFRSGGRGGGRFMHGYGIDKLVLLQQWVNQNRASLVPVNCNPMLFSFSVNEFIWWLKNVISCLDKESGIDKNTIDLILLYLGFNRTCKFCARIYSSKVGYTSVGATTDQYYQYNSSVALLFWQCSVSTLEKASTCQNCNISYVHHLAQQGWDKISFVCSLPNNYPFIMSVGRMNGHSEPKSPMKLAADSTPMHCPFSICRCCSFHRIPIQQSNSCTFALESVNYVNCYFCPHCNCPSQTTYECQHESNRVFKSQVT